MKDELKQKFYAESPFDLCSDEDNKYRDMIDEQLEADVIIEVSGGVVTEVHGLDGKSYNVVDWDNIKGN